MASADLTLRPATRDDIPTLLAMIKDLAAFQKEPDAVETTEADLNRHGFGPSAIFRCILAEVAGRPVGFALYVTTFSSWTGQMGMRIEDLWVDPATQKTGTGRALVEAVAAECVAEGGKRVDLDVLDWNPARDFYLRIGFHHKKEWLSYRLDGDALIEASARGQVVCG